MMGLHSALALQVTPVHGAHIGRVPSARQGSWDRHIRALGTALVLDLLPR